MKGSEFQWPVYRMRRFDNNIKPDLISEYAHPPAIMMKNFGRANLPYPSVFYGSPSAPIAFLETIKDHLNVGEDNFYFLSKWAFRADSNYTIVPYVFENLSERNFFNPVSKGLFNRLQDQLKDLTDEQIKIMKEIHGFLSRLFVMGNTYAVSGFIDHSYSYAPHHLRADVFIYPSVEAELHNVNFAIHPNTVLQKMLLEKVYYINVKNYERKENSLDYTINMELINVGKNFDGIIGWDQLDENEHVEFAKLFRPINAKQIN